MKKIAKIIPTVLLGASLTFGQAKAPPLKQKPSLEKKLVMDGLSLTENIISGYNAFYQVKDLILFSEGKYPNKYSKLWHYTQPLEIGGAFVLGGYSAYKNKDNFVEYTKDLAMFSALRWVVRDGIYNELRGNSFFYQSPETTSRLEPFGKWYIKLGFLAITMLYKYWNEIFGE